MFKEFKTFVNQGNAIDLAVGVVIGAAFGKIVNSIVVDILTPIFSLALGKIDFANLYFGMAGQTDPTVEEAKKHGAVIAYGLFINNVIEFFIVAFSIFIVVQQLNKLRGEKKA